MHGSWSPMLDHRMLTTLCLQLANVKGADFMWWTWAQAAAVERQKEAAREMVKRTPAKKLAGALLSKGYQVGRPQLSVGRPRV